MAGRDGPGRLFFKDKGDGEIKDNPLKKDVITLGDCGAFFVPLIFMAELMMITHTIVHAALARQPFPTVALAAFSIAFAITIIFGSISRTAIQIIITFGLDKRSIRRVWIIGFYINAIGFVVTMLIALTPLGDLVFGYIFGASDQVVQEAKRVTFVLSCISPFRVLRDVPAGLLMKERKTIFVTFGTILRFASLGGFLLGLSYVLEGALVGAVGLFGCMSLEGIFVFVCGMPIYRKSPESAVRLPSYREILRFSWPIIVNRLLENANMVLINMFLGRLANPDLALAGFGVTRGLLQLIMSPFRNLALAAQALVKTREDLRVMVRFTWLIIAIFAGILLALFYTPLRAVLLRQVMGLSGDFIRYITPAVLIFLPAPFFWGFAATSRGLLAACRMTISLAWAGVLRLAIAALIPSICLIYRDLNGAVVGVSTLMMAFTVEAGLLGYILLRAMSSRQAFACAPSAAEKGA